MTHSWQELDTAPRDGTHFLLFYGKRNAVFTAHYFRKLARTYYYEPEDLKVYSVWQILSPDSNDVLILEDEDVSDCYWRPMFKLPTDKKEKEEKGYSPRSTPFSGYVTKYPEFCSIELGLHRTRDCGCGFGQCEKGLVY